MIPDVEKIRFLNSLRSLKPIVNLRLLTESQKDFFEERTAIILYERSQEFGIVDEEKIVMEVYRMAFNWRKE